MHIVRFLTPEGPEGVGLMDSDDKIRRLPFTSIAQVYESSVQELRQALTQPGDLVDNAELLPPIPPLTEVWASGVTYLKSRDARVEESGHEDVYSLVYDAERPELFFKSAGWRVTTDGGLIGVRQDSESNIPEPELALAINSGGQIIGYLACNDVSSRSIEAENPLYLPQAKYYAGSCAVSVGIRPVWEVADAKALPITIRVERDGFVAFSGSTATSELKRDFAELIEYLFRNHHFPHGVVLSTGTGVVPDLDFTLLPGDRVQISISEVGVLTSTVVVGKRDFAEQGAVRD